MSEVPLYLAGAGWFERGGGRGVQETASGGWFRSVPNADESKLIYVMLVARLVHTASGVRVNERAQDYVQRTGADKKLPPPVGPP